MNVQCGHNTIPAAERRLRTFGMYSRLEDSLEVVKFDEENGRLNAYVKLVSLSSASRAALVTSILAFNNADCTSPLPRPFF
jgi:hypothetical protein